MWVIRIETRNEDMEIIRQMSLNQGLMIFQEVDKLPLFISSLCIRDFASPDLL